LNKKLYSLIDYLIIHYQRIDNEILHAYYTKSTDYYYRQYVIVYHKQQKRSQRLLFLNSL